MSLSDGWDSLIDELDTASRHFRAFAASKAAITSSAAFTYQDECLLEGLLSRVWQAWGIFCRHCVCESCLGTVDGNGAPIPAHAQALSDPHVSAAAIKANKKTAVPPFWGGVSTVLRHEPTWGDTDILNRIIPRLNPLNQAQLLAGFSAAHKAAKTLQAIRNASAHLNAQSIAEVRALQPSYVVFPITHPIQALFWTDPATGQFLVDSAINDFGSAGTATIS